MKNRSTLAMMVLALVLVSCGNDALPKPQAMLRLEYPKPEYSRVETNCSFTFEKNDLSKVRMDKNCDMRLEYPKMKATIYLTYKPVENNIDLLLGDAQRLTYEHVVKAANIVEQPFLNEDQGVYGMFYEVGGDAASQSQFYVTDSTKHFLTGAIYFRTKPNADSIQPAATYLKNDMRHIIESVRWN